MMKWAKLFSRELYKATKENKREIVPSDELARFVIFPIGGTGIEKASCTTKRVVKCYHDEKFFIQYFL